MVGRREGRAVKRPSAAGISVRPDWSLGPPLISRPRAVPLDVSDPATLDAWIAEGDGRTLEEFASIERGYFKPAPPPARRRFGLADAARPVLLDEGVLFIPLPPRNFEGTP